MNCWRIRQRVKPTENAVNPLMLDQRIYPVFQKYNAQCNSGLTVTLCYYKCASFPLLCFYIIGKYTNLYCTIHFLTILIFYCFCRVEVISEGTLAPSLLYFVFQEILVRQVICGMWRLQTRQSNAVSAAGPSPDSPALPRRLRGKGESRNTTETKAALRPASPHSEKLAMSHKRNDTLFYLPQNNFYLLPSFVYDSSRLLLWT